MFYTQSFFSKNIFEITPFQITIRGRNDEKNELSQSLHKQQLINSKHKHTIDHVNKNYEIAKKDTDVLRENLWTINDSLTSAKKEVSKGENELTTSKFENDELKQYVGERAKRENEKTRSESTIIIATSRRFAPRWVVAQRAVFILVANSLHQDAEEPTKRARERCQREELQRDSQQRHH